MSPVDEIWSITDSYANNFDLEDQKKFTYHALVIAPARGSKKIIRLITSSRNLTANIYSIKSNAFEPLSRLTVVRIRPLHYEHLYMIEVRPMQAMLLSFEGQKQFKPKFGLKVSCFMFKSNPNTGSQLKSNTTVIPLLKVDSKTIASFCNGSLTLYDLETDFKVTIGLYQYTFDPSRIE